MSAIEQAIAAIASAKRAAVIVGNATDQFVEACREGNWDKAEAARATALDALGAHFDQIATAFRVIEPDRQEST